MNVRIITWASMVIVPLSAIVAAALIAFTS